jgi:hypothetical protein
MFRDGDDFVIIDEQGVRAGDGRDRVEIDEKRIRIFHDGQQLDFDLDQLDFGGLGIFEGLEDLGSEGLPSGQPGVFDPQELEGSLGELDELGGALEREMQIELEQLDQLEELMNLGDLEQLMELDDVMRLFDGGQIPVPPGTPVPPGVPAPPAAPTTLL